MKKVERIDKLYSLTRAFWKSNSNVKYRVYTDRLIEILIKGNIYDVNRGKIEILAAAIVWIIIKLNLLNNINDKNYISIDKLCDYFGTKKITIETKAKKIEAVCEIMVGHEGLCREEISDAFTFLQFENGTIITKAMAKKHGII